MAESILNLSFHFWNSYFSQRYCRTWLALQGYLVIFWCSSLGTNDSFAICRKLSDEMPHFINFYLGRIFLACGKALSACFVHNGTDTLLCKTKRAHSTIFVKSQNGFNGILRGPWKSKSWKKPEVENLMADYTFKWSFRDVFCSSSFSHFSPLIPYCSYSYFFYALHSQTSSPLIPILSPFSTSHR